MPYWGLSAVVGHRASPARSTGSRTYFDGVPMPEYLKPIPGGLLLGALGFFLPQVFGVGYPAMEQALQGKYGLGLLLVLVLAKVLAVSLTIGSGGSGGVFAPSLFVGAMLGTAFGTARRGAPARPDRPARRLWPGGDGGSVHRRGTGADDGGDHPVRADRRLSHHPASDARGGDQHARLRGVEHGYDLHAQATPAGDRSPRRPRRGPDARHDRRRGDDDGSAARRGGRHGGRGRGGARADLAPCPDRDRCQRKSQWHCHDSRCGARPARQQAWRHPGGGSAAAPC